MKRDHGFRAQAMALAMLLAGCTTNKPARPQPYTGPTLSLAELAGRVNARNAKLQTLWSRGSFEATIVETGADGKPGEGHYLNGDLYLNYRRPEELRLYGNKDIAGRIFDIGANRDRFWMIAKGGVDTMWWGETAKMSSANRRIPVQPALLLQVLGLTPFDADLLAQPAPVLRINPDAESYMVTWQTLESDRWVAQKEIWYDVHTLMPKSVFLFDPNGRIVLRAFLTGASSVDAPGDRPNVATHYQLYFPDNGSRMTFDLRDMTVSHNGLPNDHTFAFPDPDPELKHVIRVDEDAGTTAGASPGNSARAAR